MSLTLLLALQAAAPHPAPILAPIDFDLARLPRLDLGALGAGRPACDRSDPVAIVVCGRRGRGLYPLDAMADEFEPRPIRADVGLIGNLRGAAYLQSVPMPQGQVSNRAMVGIRLPF